MTNSDAVTEQNEVPAGLVALSQLGSIIANLPFPYAKAVPLINEIEAALRAGHEAARNNRNLRTILPFEKPAAETTEQEAPASNE